mgnify:CR=1 FL=1
MSAASGCKRVVSRSERSVGGRYKAMAHAGGPLVMSAARLSRRSSGKCRLVGRGRPASSAIFHRPVQHCQGPHLARRARRRSPAPSLWTPASPRLLRLPALGSSAISICLTASQQQSGARPRCCSPPLLAAAAGAPAPTTRSHEQLWHGRLRRCVCRRLPWGKQAASVNTSMRVAILSLCCSTSCPCLLPAASPRPALPARCRLSRGPAAHRAPAEGAGGGEKGL